MAEFRIITPHLTVRDAKAAIEFYKAAFGAVEKYSMPSLTGDGIMFAELEIGNSVIFLNDEFPEYGLESPATLNGSPVTIHLQVDNADAWFNRAISAGATETMPLDDMFWGDRYGRLVDPFGHYWSIASQFGDVSREEMMRQAAAELAG